MLRPLFKRAEVSLTGLSPRARLTAATPEPMATPALDKARSILDRCDGLMGNEKTAAKKKHKPIVEGYQLPTVSGQSHKNPWDHVKSVAGHTLAGAAAGKTIAELSSPTIGGRGKWMGAASGAAVGLGDYAYQKVREHRTLKGATKTAAGFSPLSQLRLGQQVGRTGTTLNKSMSPMRGVPTLGNKGRLPNGGAMNKQAHAELVGAILARSKQEEPKEKVAHHVSSFFAEQPWLTEAQRRFPELLKVAHKR